MEGNLPEARNQLQNSREMLGRLIALDNSKMQSSFFMIFPFSIPPSNDDKPKDLNENNT